MSYRYRALPRRLYGMDYEGVGATGSRMSSAWTSADTLTVAVLLRFPELSDGTGVGIIQPTGGGPTGTEMFSDNYSAFSIVDSIGMIRNRATTDTAMTTGNGWMTAYRGRLMWWFFMDYGDTVLNPDIWWAEPNPLGKGVNKLNYVTSYADRVMGVGALSTPDSTLSVGMKANEGGPFPASGLYGLFAWPKVMSDTEMIQIANFDIIGGASCAHWLGLHGGLISPDLSGNNQPITWNDTPMGDVSEDFGPVILPATNYRVRRRSRVKKLRPNATVAAGSWTAKPSGTLHGVTSDEDDATYAESTATPDTSEIAKLGMDNPATGVGEPVTVRAKWRQD